MDRPGADLHQTTEMMNTMLGANAVVYQIPVGKEEDFSGIVDLVEEKLYTYDDLEMKESEIPENLREEARHYRHLMIEKLADFDDLIMEKYVHEEEILAEDIYNATRKAVLRLLITPVFCGSAFKNKGIRLLLDAVIRYLPSPIDRGIVLGYDTSDPSITLSRKPSWKRPFSALAFKIINDNYVGQQTFIRVYSGELKTSSFVLNSTKNKRERIGRILRIHAKQREEIDVLRAGDIGALIGMKYTTTGDTLCEEENPVLLENISCPDTVLDMKVEPVTIKERDRLGVALNKMSMEDPSFKVAFDDETEETIISGMGELHLEVIVDRLKNEHKVDVVVGKPAVAYRETILQEVRHQYKLKKQSGGHGQYAHIVFRLEPNQDKGLEFSDHIKGGNIPREYIPAIEKGFRATMEKGLLAGYPMVNIKFTLIDGSFHEVDSSEMAFRTCTELAIKDIIKKAEPQLLEPMMKIEINTPDEYMGDIIADINRRRGQIDNMRRYRKGSQKLNGRVPLGDMFGYASTLRTISSGRANYSMEFMKYNPLPKAIEEKILEERRKQKSLS
jgi:elongation factor G